MPCDWLCAIHYLTDIEPGTPAFCVVPKSNMYNSLQEAFNGLDDDHLEVPIYAPAGTCILYDTAIFHTRRDGDGIRARRTWHQYYARGGWLPTDTRYDRPPTPVLTNWNLFPERLALHPDPKKTFFSHWNTAQWNGLPRVLQIISENQCLEEMNNYILIIDLYLIYRLYRELSKSRKSAV